VPNVANVDGYKSGAVSQLIGYARTVEPKGILLNLADLHDFLNQTLSKLRKHGLEYVAELILTHKLMAEYPCHT
jgi:hypothetical protein